MYDETLGDAGRIKYDLRRVSEGDSFIVGADPCTDCYSLYSTLKNPDLVRPQAESLVVCFSALK